MLRLDFELNVSSVLYGRPHKPQTHPSLWFLLGSYPRGRFFNQIFVNLWKSQSGLNLDEFHNDVFVLVFGGWKRCFEGWMFLCCALAGGGRCGDNKTRVVFPECR